LTEPSNPARASGPGEAQATLTQAADSLIRFGILMLRAGDAAFRVRQWTGAVARAIGIEALSLQIALGGMSLTARRDHQHVTLVSEVAPLGINAWRIGALEGLANEAKPGLTARELNAKLDAIEAQPPIYPLAVTVLAVSAASGSFCYLTDGGHVEIIGALAGGGAGQWLRSVLFRYRLNQFAVTAIAAVVATGVYYLITAGLAAAGLPVPRHQAGFISSVLFLVPGFPLIAGMLDLLQHQIVGGIARLAYAAVILMSAAFGLCLVAAAAGLTLAPPPPPASGELATLALRALASFAGGCGFAILYNSSPRTVFAVGCLALVGNELRLALHDAGMALAPATFLGALAVGVLATLTRPYVHEPRIALTVAGIIIMVPGSYTFQTIVLFNEGSVLQAMQAATLAGFVVGAMALGLATARFISERRWLVES